MKVFHHGSYRLSDVGSSAAAECSVEQTLRIFFGLHDDGSFLGIELDEHRVLQMRSEEGVFYTEVLDKSTRSIEHCVLNIPMAEEVIRAAFEGRDFRQIPLQAFLKWHHEILPSED
jgi:hypothetical protein